MLAAGPPPAATQTPGEVSLYVTVEEQGKLVSGLGPDNFRLFEDGQSRPFQLAKPETPASVVLLLEYSRSSWPYLNDIEHAIQGFMDHAPEGNWYALATYSHDLSIDVDFTKQIGRISQAFNELPEPEWDDAEAYDAVYKTLDIMDRLPGRRVLILISSGLDSFSRHTLGDVQKKIEETNVVVYGLGLGSLFRGVYDPYLSTGMRMDLFQAQAFMKMLANKSGGEAWFPDFATAFPDEMAGVMQDLQYQYRLVYKPQAPHEVKLRKIKVEAFSSSNGARVNYKVLVREGWRY